MTTTTAAPTAISVDTDRPLRIVMNLDAVVTGANGIAYVAAASILSDFLGPAVALLVPIGIFLIVHATIIALVGRARPIPAGGVQYAIVANLAWVAGSLAYASLAEQLTTIGRVWAVLQAFTVLAFAIAQIVTNKKRQPQL